MSRAALAVGHARAIIESSEDAVISTDREATITSWNAAATRLYGYAPEEAIGRSIAMLIPPPRAGDERRILGRTLGGERILHYETERLRKDGTIVIVSLTISPIYEAEEIVGASVIARDTTERRLALERADRLQRATAALSREVSVERAANVVLDEAIPALGANAATVGLLSEDGERVALVARRGYSKAGVEPWQEFPMSAEVPMTAAIRDVEPVWCTTADELKSRFSGLAEAKVTFAANAVVPLSVEGVTFGAIAFSFRDPREFPPEERAFLLAISQQAANAVRRAQLRASERRLREQFAFLAEASEILSGSLDLETTLQRLARIAVPGLADWCSVALVEEDTIRNVAIAHADPDKVETARSYNERYPPDPTAPMGAPKVIRTGEPELYPVISDAMLAQAARDDEHLRLLRDLRFSSAMIVPLIAGGVTRGAITFVAAESGMRFGQAELTLAADLARHAGLAVDNAARYREQRDTALTLQRALLPARLPEIPGIEFATRYLPAGPGAEAGGDWYDVIDLGEGELAVVIGDVSGRGVQAASVMGRLRTAIRAYALEGHAPDAVLGRLHNLMQDFEEREMATIFYLRVNSATREADYVRAGHLPALVRAADGTVRELGDAGSPPVGVLDDPRYRTGRSLLERGSMILLFTDGLVERRDSGIDPSLEQLKQALAVAPRDAYGCIDFVLDQLGPTAEEDDIALLAVALDGAGSGAGAVRP